MNTVILSPYSFVYPSLSHRNAIFSFSPFSVTILKDNRIGTIHWHDYPQIWYTASGEYVHTINGVSYIQKPGDIMIVFPYMVHSIDTSGSNMENALIYEFSIRNDLLKNSEIPFLSHTYCKASFDSLFLSPSIRFEGKDKEKADEICSALKKECDKKFAMRTTKIAIELSALLKLCVQNSSDVVSKHELKQTIAKHQFLDTAMSFICENESSKITLDDICSVAMTSRSVFSLNFTETTGRTFHNYLTSMRISSAIKLLRRTKKSVSEIAKECGFSNVGHLTKTCIKLVGDSPLAIRRTFSELAQKNGDYLFNHYKQEYGWAIDYDGELLDKHHCAMSFY